MVLLTMIKGTNRRASVTNGVTDDIRPLDRLLISTDSSVVERRSLDAARDEVFTPARERLPLRLSWILLAAAGLGAFSTAIAETYKTFSPGMSGTLPVLASLNLSYWYAWAILVPGMLWVARRFRFDRDTWRRTVPVHLVAVTVFTVAHAALAALGRVWTMRLLMGREVSFLMSMQERILNFDYGMVTYWFIVGLSHALDYRRESDDRAITAAQLETRLAEANLQALQRQLHPHFLFNTLHTISALMHRDIEAADAMLARLSDLLRLTLDRIRTQQLQLKEELDFIEKYLEIERTRFGDRLRVVFDIDPTVLDAAVPSLVLQPLVENALRHGIGPKVGGGRIDIVAKREGDNLRLVVRDDGYGVPADELDALNEGVGVSNTRSRLQHIYGARHRFEFRTPPGGGLEVTVVIPLVPLPEASDPRAMESVA